MTEEFDEPVAPDEAQFGAFLRRERELRGIGLEYVADFTRIHQTRIVELEEGRWTSFVAWVYLRGAVQNYARAVGLDVHDVLLRLEADVPFTEQLSGGPAVTQENPLFRRPLAKIEGASSARRWLLVAAALLAVGFGALVLREQLRRFAGVETDPPAAAPAANAFVPATAAVTAATTATAVTAPATPPPAPEPAAKPAPPPAPKPAPKPAAEPLPRPQARAAPDPAAERHTLRIHAVEQSWMSIAADGSEPKDVILPKGQDYQVTATQEIIFLTGNAGGVELHVDGVPEAPLGATGVVRRRVFRFATEEPAP